MSIQLAFLGTGTCNSTAKNPMSLAISNGDQVVLVDVGGGAYHQLARLTSTAFHYKNISTVFITHFHIDHVSGLPDLLWGEMWDQLGRRDVPLVIVGPLGLYNFFNDRLLPFFGDYPLPFEVKLVELVDEALFEGDFFTARSYHLNHGEFSTGYLFEFSSCKLAVSGDTGYCENLIRLLRDSDVAILEWSITDFNTYPGHLASSDIIKLIKLDALPPRTYIVHMYPVAGKNADEQRSQCREILREKSPSVFFPGDLEIINL